MSARPFLGQMRHRLTIEAPVETPDDTGGVTRTWTTAGNLWAQIRTIRSVPREIADHEEAVVTHAILFRARPTVTAGMRLRKDARIFRILSIDNFDELSTFVRALCEEVRP